MLRRRDGLVILRIVPLQTFDEGNAQPRGQIWILAVYLLPPAPARIAEDVDVGRPDGQTKEDRVVIVLQRFDILCARLICDHRCYTMDERRIPRGCQTNSLRKDRGVSG